MAFLHEKLDTIREIGAIASLPAYIPENLNPLFDLRPYQEEAFENFITYFENGHLRQKPTQVLFRMATGSGKTLIMAGLMLYLYKQGYRNFLFFVNLSNIIEKTKENFNNQTSSKYLFADEIVIDGERIGIQEVDNFQYSDPERINICFSTTQGLHADMWEAREGAMSFDDFEGQKVVLISDEAHHLNVDTRRMTVSEESSYHSWESTVKNILYKSNENVLLEFTATCDLENPAIHAAYESRIVFDYPLEQFYRDGYSKDIRTLRSDLTIMERALQALVLSQYRLKLFQDRRLTVKPVVLFKAAKIAESKRFKAEFEETVSKLTGGQLLRLSTIVDNPIMQQAYGYFAANGISLDTLAQELRDDFSEQHCISVNDDGDATREQILLNSLEDLDNPYRAIFEVKKLDEGWDVLNLYDIVRLYETRQSGGRRISPATISEAQLIGRGARYCPFQLDDEQPRYQRKYDHDITNEMRVCEQLYYHCQNDHRYITELHDALRDIGLDTQRAVQCVYALKDEFKSDDLYVRGLVFINERRVKDRKEVHGLAPSVRDNVFTYTAATGASGMDAIMEDSYGGSDTGTALRTFRTTLGDLAKLNYALVNKALMKYPVFKFDTLHSYFPNIRSTREVITSDKYLGGIRIDIRSGDESPTMQVMFDAAFFVLGKIANSISGIEEAFYGTREFRARWIHEVFSDKTVNVTDPHDGGVGVSQNDVTVYKDWRIDLSSADWFAYTDSFGTSEEKAFVAYFRNHVDDLKKEYSKIYLVRNERVFHLYSFEGGERFEPDYVLFLQKSKTDGFDQIQLFIEPKGTHLMEKDAWKERFLLQMRDSAIPVKQFRDDGDYRIWGLHFFNRDTRMVEFDQDFSELIEG